MTDLVHLRKLAERYLGIGTIEVNPITIIQLLDRIVELETGVNLYRQGYDEKLDQIEKLQMQVSDYQKALKNISEDFTRRGPVKTGRTIAGNLAHETLKKWGRK